MSRRLFGLGLWGFAVLLSNGPSLAQTLPYASNELALSNQSAVAEPTAGLSPTPTQPAGPIPAESNISTAPPAGPGLLPDTANTTKFYTITASLREAYDDNIYTTKDNPTASSVTSISPSFLVNFPLENSDFSARYTFGLYYYENRTGNPVDQTHELNLLYTHQFSGRYSLTAQDQFGYYAQPDLLNATGSPFVNGSYFANTATANFEAQWTPLFGTSTSYSNILVLYQESQIGTVQNNDENTFSHDFRFAVFPKINLTAGAIYDNVTYFQDSRGYSSYTLDGGVDWQALPNVSVTVRVGGEYTESSLASDSITPYASASLQWVLGKRSFLNFDYTHSVVPSDVANAIGQEADRFSGRFSYDLTSRITLHLAGIETHSEYDSDVLQNGVPSFDEDDFETDLGAEYSVNGNFSFEAGYLLSDISSQENYRDYTRNQVYVGVRGTY